MTDTRLLTDEEIRELGLVHYNKSGDVDDVDIGGIAQAQLTKILEWGDEDCLDHFVYGQERKRSNCEECWQELQEDAKK